MAVSYYVGSFASSTGANGVTQDITAPGFDPVATIFFHNVATADGSSASAFKCFGVGRTAGEEWALSWVEADADATPESFGRNDPNYAIMVMGTSGTVVRRGDYSVVTGGFRITWALNEATARIINYIAIGGDVTDAKALSFTSPASTDANYEVTGVGFQGDVVLLVSDAQTTTDTLIGESYLSMGMGKSSSERWCVAATSDTAPASNTFSFQTTASVYNIINTSGTIIDKADLVGFTSDGFDLNFNVVSAARKIYALVLKGGTHKLGTGTQKTSTGTEDTSTGGVDPVGVFLQSINQTSSASVQNAYRHSIGAAHSTSQRACIWDGHADAQPDSITDKDLDRTKVIKMMTEGTPTVDAAADLSSLGAEKFTLDWTSADGSAREFVYWAVGAAPAGGGGGGSTTGLLTLLGCG